MAENVGIQQRNGWNHLRKHVRGAWGMSTPCQTSLLPPCSYEILQLANRSQFFRSLQNGMLWYLLSKMTNYLSCHRRDIVWKFVRDLNFKLPAIRLLSKAQEPWEGNKALLFSGSEFQFNNVLKMDSGDDCTIMCRYLMLLTCTSKMVKWQIFVMHI
jgi:hypothetical protein